jgi:hypothetical protein
MGRVMAVNLNSVFTTIQSCAFHMKKPRAGRIIITTSIASFRNQAGSALHAGERQRCPFGEAGRRAGACALQYHRQRHCAGCLRDKHRWRQVLAANEHAYEKGLDPLEMTEWRPYVLAAMEGRVVLRL